MEREVKQRNRMTKAQSQLVCDLYAATEGDWKSIMRDKRIKALGQSKEYLATHIQNKKKRVRMLARDEDEDDEEGAPTKKERRRNDTTMLKQVYARQEALELGQAEIQGTLSEILELLQQQQQQQPQQKSTCVYCALEQGTVG